jgi:hypothetical protein
MPTQCLPPLTPHPHSPPPAPRPGGEDEFVFSGRLDNLCMSWCSLQALVDTCASPDAMAGEGLPRRAAAPPRCCPAAPRLAGTASAGGGAEIARTWAGGGGGYWGSGGRGGRSRESSNGWPDRCRGVLLMLGQHKRVRGGL